MAGRHGVPSQGRKEHAQAARRQRRRRVQRRDAAQPWLLWLSFRVVLALVVVGAAVWSAVLIRRGQGGYWPVVAVAAGALSLFMIALDVRARRRQRVALRVPSIERLAPPPTPTPTPTSSSPSTSSTPPAPTPQSTPPRQYRGSHHAEAEPPAAPALPVQRSEERPPGRHAHRR